MKPKKISQKQILSSSDQVGPDDGVDPRVFFRKSSWKKTNRKALQMCGEIARTLSMVLSWESGDALLRELMVEAVEPAPDSTRVLITVSVETGSFGLGEAVTRLRRAGGMLRREVAAAIHRKRVPELAFRVIRRGEAPS